MKRRLVSGLLASLMAATALAFAPATAEAVGPWTRWSAYQYSPVKTTECNRLRDLGASYKWPYCRSAVRYRSRVISRPGIAWLVDQVQIEATGLLSVWGQRSTTLYRYDGREVWTDGSTICATWGILVDIETTWCGAWNDGGRNWGFLEAGMNTRVSAVWRGLPIKFDHGHRIRIYVSGHRCCWLVW